MAPALHPDDRAVGGQNVGYEPTGPNTPLATDGNGNQLYPGPGYNAFIDRPSNVPGLILGGGGTVPGLSTRAGATGDTTSNTITDNSAVATDQGRSVTGINIPDGATVGTVTDSPTTATGPAGAYNPLGTTPNPTLPEAPLAVALPAVAALIGGGVCYTKRRRNRAGNTT